MAYDYSKFLVSRWSMSEVNTPDTGFIGQGADMTGVGLVAATNIVQGRTSWATEFNGADEYMVRTEAAWRVEDTQGSIAAWIKPAAFAGRVFSSSDEATNNHRMSVFLRAGRTVSLYWRDGATIREMMSPAVLTLGTWTHICFVSTGTAYGIFINGVGVAIAVVGANDGAWLADLPDRDNVTIGANITTVVGSHFPGVIDDVRYYSRGLSGIDAADLYARSRRGATGGEHEPSHS